jgi:hypothetical protein
MEGEYIHIPLHLPLNSLHEPLRNITIATFAEASLYKYEAYSPSLYAGAILNAHGLPVAYKSVCIP